MHEQAASFSHPIQEECVLLFERTHELMAAEQCLQASSVSLRIMSIPAAIRSGCGLALRINPAELSLALKLLSMAKLQPVSLYRRKLIDGRSNYSAWENTENA